MIYTFLLSSVKYVGHIILADGLTPRERRSQAILEEPIYPVCPHCKCFCSFFRVDHHQLTWPRGLPVST